MHQLLCRKHTHTVRRQLDRDSAIKFQKLLPRKSKSHTVTTPFSTYGYNKISLPPLECVAFLQRGQVIWGPWTPVDFAGSAAATLSPCEAGWTPRAGCDTGQLAVFHTGPGLFPTFIIKVLFLAFRCWVFHNCCSHSWLHFTMFALSFGVCSWEVFVKRRVCQRMQKRKILCFWSIVKLIAHLGIYF